MPVAGGDGKAIEASIWLKSTGMGCLAGLTSVAIAINRCGVDIDGALVGPLCVSVMASTDLGSRAFTTESTVKLDNELALRFLP